MNIVFYCISFFFYFKESASAICDFYISNQCTRGQLCPLRHVRGNQAIVCKHWLRGLCKKGDDCEFLHKYDMEKMPECYFYIRFGMFNHSYSMVYK